jgi:hypothetical protein
VYSLYMTRRTEDVSCVLRDELAVAASISVNPRKHVLFFVGSNVLYDQIIYRDTRFKPA